MIDFLPDFLQEQVSIELCRSKENILINDLSKVTFLQYHSTVLDGMVESHQTAFLRYFKNLQVLNFINIDFYPADEKYLSAVASLSNLSFENCVFETSLDSLKNLKNLKVVSFNNCANVDFNFIAKLKSIEQVRLNANMIEQNEQNLAKLSRLGIHIAQIK